MAYAFYDQSHQSGMLKTLESPRFPASHIGDR